MIRRIIIMMTLGVIGLASAPNLAFAIGSDPAGEYGVRIARVKYGGGGDWYADASSIPNWLREFERRTGIKTYPE